MYWLLLFMFCCPYRVREKRERESKDQKIIRKGQGKTMLLDAKRTYSSMHNAGGGPPLPLRREGERRAQKKKKKTTVTYPGFGPAMSLGVVMRSG